MPRRPRIEFADAVYHVITRGNNRQKVFKDDRDRKACLERLSYYCEKSYSAERGVESEELGTKELRANTQGQARIDECQ